MDQLAGSRRTGRQPPGGRKVDAKAEASYRRGVALMEQGQWRDAADAFTQATQRRADEAIYWLNLAHVMVKLGLLDDAAAAAQRAIALDPTSQIAVAVAVQCLQLAHRHDEAIAVMDRRAPGSITDPNLHFVHGQALSQIARLPDALDAYMRALALKPSFMPAHVQLGNVFDRLKMHEESRQCYETAILMGGCEAELRSAMAFQSAQACRWDLVQKDNLDLQRALVANRGRGPVPFHYLTMSETRAPQLEVARGHARALFGAIEPLPAALPHAPGGRIRIGYASSDFREHATAYLLIEILERHDRARFEVFVYSYGLDDGKAMRARVAAASEHFADVRDLSDRAIAEMVRADGIDILLDAKGYTLGARNGIFAYRAAPVQINYLAFPGSLGAPFYDYLIGDPVATPFEHAADYDEKIAQLPSCYQPNDRQRTVAPALARTEYGLPEQGFVFCCFNNAFKIAPGHFNIWCALLQAVDGSVLWLYEANAQARRNLSAEALRRGIDPARLIWAPHLPLAQHLARLRHADLVLDTLPYNAHTTASDALWVGVPVVTCPGETFASRVAASLLHAAGCPETIVETLDDYAVLALQLARDPQRLQELRDKISAGRDHCALFNSARYTRDLERLFERMVERQRRGDAPCELAPE